MKTGLVVCVALASAGLGALAAWPLQDARAKDAQAKPSQETLDAQRRWEVSMTPGPHHKALADMGGKWTADVSYIAGPGAPPTPSTGTAEMSMIMDGRFLKNDFTGSGPMGPFKGLGLTGYNNTTDKYEDLWLDAMGTHMVWSTGTWDGESDAITYHGEYVDPMTQKPVSARSIMRKVTADEYAFQMYSKSGDTPEFLMLDIKYTRQK